MRKCLFDIEADGLLDSCTRMWVMAVMDLDSGAVVTFREGDMGWADVLSKTELVVGHNIIDYDLMVLKKLFGFKLPRSVKRHDTLIFSQVLDYKRFGEDGHSLDVWGRHLRFPKIPFDDWSQFSEEMEKYCINDVHLNHRVYKVLLEELHRIAARNPSIKTYIRAEHYVAEWCAEAAAHGWPFNTEAAVELFNTLEAEMSKAYTALSHKLGMKCVAVDRSKGVVEEKRPRWTKEGFYDANTAKWFGVDPCSGFEGEERMILGPYCRVEFAPLSLDSVQDVKTFLFRHGWQPTTWNYKVDEKGKKQKTSPKITEDSLEFLGGDGKLYSDFLVTKSRHGILKTWLNNVDDEGLLHGYAVPIGTPSMRTRHQIIANVPTADSVWGPEIRKLFGCLPGWKIVGCDSSGNQARGLAHYLGDKDYINTLLTGDIHTYNADILTRVLSEMGVEKKVERAQAKRVLYAFLFGASGAKLWSYIFGSLDVERGNRLKNGFVKAVPGFKALLEKLEKMYGSTKKGGAGYIPSIAGNRLYVDSFHKLLVYLLQGCEKVTCATALMLTMESLEKEGIPYIPLIMYHDEENFMVPEEHTKRAAEIGKMAFREGPKLYGINIMDGESKIGETWYEVH